MEQYKGLIISFLLLLILVSSSIFSTASMEQFLTGGNTLHYIEEVKYSCYIGVGPATCLPRYHGVFLIDIEPRTSKAMGDTLPCLIHVNQSLTLEYNLAVLNASMLKTILITLKWRPVIRLVELGGDKHRGAVLILPPIAVTGNIEEFGNGNGYVKLVDGTIVINDSSIGVLKYDQSTGLLKEAVIKSFTYPIYRKINDVNYPARVYTLNVTIKQYTKQGSHTPLSTSKPDSTVYITIVAAAITALTITLYLIARRKH